MIQISYPFKQNMNYYLNCILCDNYIPVKNEVLNSTQKKTFLCKMDYGAHNYKNMVKKIIISTYYKLIPPKKKRKQYTAFVY